MPGEVKLEDRYERFGWPSIARPDVKPPAGWSLSLLTAVNRVHNHALSPDGTTVAFVWDRDGLSDVYTLPTAGGWPARLSTNRGPIVYWSDECPQWSPDGKWLAFTIRGHVHIVAAAGGIPRRVTDFAVGASSPIWLPDSNQLIVSVERHDATKLLLTDRDGAWPRALTRGPGDDWDAQPAPDGRLVAFVHYPHDDLNRLDLRLVDVATGQIQELTGVAGQKDWSPRWAPDGSLIAFLSQRSGFNEAWLIRPDGGGLRQLTHLGLDVANLAWSPDGTRLACTLNRAGAFDLALIDVRTGQVADLRVGVGYHTRPNWSPQGDSLTVEYEDPTRPPDVYRVEVPGGRTTQLTHSNLPALAQNSFVTPEPVAYKGHDELEIPGFLYRPAEPNQAALLVPHGGPSAQYTYEWDVWAQYLVAKGYTVLAPNYRGSTGYGVAFEHANYNDWGLGDTQDCLQGAQFLHTLDWIDPQRIAIAGSSYGGYLVACCLSRDPDYLFACGISKYGDANLFSSWAQCRRDVRLYTEMMIGHPARNRGVYAAASPISEVERIRKPVLLLHGLQDEIVPPQSSEEWVEALRRAGKTFEYRAYAGEPHGFLRRETALDAYARSERFLDWYLMP